jgi:hypothetical protein
MIAWGIAMPPPCIPAGGRDPGLLWAPAFFAGVDRIFGCEHGSRSPIELSEWV